MTDPALDLALRVGLTAAAGAGVIAGRAVLLGWRDRRRRRAMNGAPLPELAAGEPTVLLFTGALCGDCIEQKEILQEIRTRLGGWRIQEVRAAVEPSLATRFGVLSVPATVVLDQQGRPVSINYGLQAARPIVRQLRACLLYTSPSPRD